MTLFPSERFATFTLEEENGRLEEREKVPAEELGQELTPRGKLHVASADACAPRRALVLCIEDNKAQREMRKEILETGGFLVICASSASEAIEIVRETPISLVLSDHMLSGASGADLAAEIKKINLSCRSCFTPADHPSQCKTWTASLTRANLFRHFFR